jgi:hypothetical protein
MLWRMAHLAQHPAELQRIKAGVRGLRCNARLAAYTGRPAEKSARQSTPSLQECAE